VRALALHQPFASLIAIGAKRVETRHWPAPAALIGERLAIHATLSREDLYLVAGQPFLRALQHAYREDRLVLVDGELPLGAIVATAVLDRCSAITEPGTATLRERAPDEYAFGNYSLRRGPRYAWVMRDIEALMPPVRFKGRQRIFFVPDELLTAAQGALL